MFFNKKFFDGNRGRIELSSKKGEQENDDLVNLFIQQIRYI